MDNGIYKLINSTEYLGSTPLQGESIDIDTRNIKPYNSNSLIYVNTNTGNVLTQSLLDAMNGNYDISGDFLFDNNVADKLLQLKYISNDIKSKNLYLKSLGYLTKDENSWDEERENLWTNLSTHNKEYQTTLMGFMKKSLDILTDNTTYTKDPRDNGQIIQDDRSEIDYNLLLLFNNTNNPIGYIWLNIVPTAATIGGLKLLGSAAEGMGVLGEATYPYIAPYIHNMPILLKTGIDATFAALSAYNLASEDGIQKTVNNFSNGNIYGGIKSLGGDLLDASMLFPVAKGIYGASKDLYSNISSRITPYGFRIGKYAYKPDLSTLYVGFPINFNKKLLEQYKEVNPQHAKNFGEVEGRFNRSYAGEGTITIYARNKGPKPELSKYKSKSQYRKAKEAWDKLSDHIVTFTGTDGKERYVSKDDIKMLVNEYKTMKVVDPEYYLQIAGMKKLSENTRIFTTGNETYQKVKKPYTVKFKDRDITITECALSDELNNYLYRRQESGKGDLSKNIPREIGLLGQSDIEISNSPGKPILLHQFAKGPDAVYSSGHKMYHNLSYETKLHFDEVAKEFFDSRYLKMKDENYKGTKGLSPGERISGLWAEVLNELMKYLEEKHNIKLATVDKLNEYLDRIPDEVFLSFINNAHSGLYADKIKNPQALKDLMKYKIGGTLVKRKFTNLLK